MSTSLSNLIQEAVGLPRPGILAPPGTAELFGPPVEHAASEPTANTRFRRDYQLTGGSPFVSDPIPAFRWIRITTGSAGFNCKVLWRFNPADLVANGQWVNQVQANNLGVWDLECPQGRSVVDDLGLVMSDARVILFSAFNQWVRLEADVEPMVPVDTLPFASNGLPITGQVSLTAGGIWVPAAVVPFNLSIGAGAQATILAGVAGQFIYGWDWNLFQETANQLLLQDDLGTLIAPTGKTLTGFFPHGFGGAQLAGLGRALVLKNPGGVTSNVEGSLSYRQTPATPPQPN